MDIYVLFIVLTHAFDTMSVATLLQIPPPIGIPPKMVNIIQCFQKDLKAKLVNCCKNDGFPVTNGEKQGLVLAQTEFQLHIQHGASVCSKGVRPNCDDDMILLIAVLLCIRDVMPLVDYSVCPLAKQWYGWS